MNWNMRNQANTKEEAIQALTDGIANNIEPSQLHGYADIWDIPLALQVKASDVPEPEPVDEDEEDYYDSDEYYYESSY